MEGGFVQKDSILDDVAGVQLWRISFRAVFLLIVERIRSTDEIVTVHYHDISSPCTIFHPAARVISESPKDGSGQQR